MKKKSSLTLTPTDSARTPVLRQLLVRADQHMAVEEQVLAALPPGLRQGVRFVSCDEGALVLRVESSAIASQLRFRQHEVMAALREQEQLRFVWQLKVKVAPARYQQRQEPRKLTLSDENARLLREEAGHTKDKALREVLEKLASHVRS